MFNTNPDCKKLIEDGKCKADCCGVVPIEYHIFQQIKKFAYEKKFEIKKFSTKGKQFCTPIAEDGKCVFLNRKTYLCEIYNSPRKPEICSQFGMNEKVTLLACPHINQELTEKIDTEVDSVLERIKKQFEKGGSKC